MGFRNRTLATAYVIALLIAVVAGCSTRDELSETINACGNHTCGDLAMVTIDTSTDGFQYLEPELAPDGMRIAFTADWAAIPSINPDDLDEPIENRQILLLPVPAGIWADSMLTRTPVLNVADPPVFGHLVYLEDFNSLIGGDEHQVLDAHRINKGSPTWVSDDSLIFWVNFDSRDRLVIADVANPSSVTPRVLFYEPDDLVTAGWFYYHHDPALSPDGRWLAFTRFGCNRPNDENRVCTQQALWVLDMWSTDDPTQARAYPVTSEAARLQDPAWSWDGTRIVFSATTDLEGSFGNSATELFSVAFDTTGLAATDSIAIDESLRRLTYTDVSEGDPIQGLQNEAPIFGPGDSRIYFVSSRRAPGSTQRGRNIWQIPSDGRLDPEIVFFSREDDVDPDITRDGTLLFSSKMGFPTEYLDRQESLALEALRADTTVDRTEVEIERLAAEEREQLAFFEGVMSHIYLFRNW